MLIKKKNALNFCQPTAGVFMPATDANSTGRGLFTDLYELTMTQAYLAEGMEGQAVFELFFRELPETRNYVLTCGLEPALEFLENFRYSASDIDYLRGTGTLSDACLERLARLRFTGDVLAVPEGTVVFPHEPVLQVVAPLPEAQVVETGLLNIIHHQSVIATKAARIMHAAAGRPVLDFGARRAHGLDAAMTLARTAWIAGSAGTSNLAAGRAWGIPVRGTMAHSFVQAHESESAALEAFVAEFPDTTLLVDTYDTLAGVDKVIALAERLGDRFRVAAIRLDSGDLGELAREARVRLDRAGLEGVRIVASSGLNEYRIAELVESGAPIDAFGVGTHMAVSRDNPEIDFAYKLVEYDDSGRMKTSSRKMSLPGRKQVFRQRRNGRLVRDMLARHDETMEGEALLRPVMQGGRRLPEQLPDIRRIREHAAAELASLPPALHQLQREDPPFSAQLSPGLAEDRDRLLARLR
jgi:nicotinate phosphoribosyltransferase